jgi:hypothetical protein
MSGFYEGFDGSGVQFSGVHVRDPDAEWRPSPPLK